MQSKNVSEKTGDELRSKVTNYIQAHPGSSFSSIRTIFEVPDSTLRYHLRYLEKEGKIKSDDKRRVYYPHGYLSNGGLTSNQLHLVDVIRKNYGISQKGISSKIRMNRMTIRSNIKYLVQKEIISVARIGKELHHFYIFPEELKRKKALRLVTKFLLEKIDEESYWDLRTTLPV